MITARAVPALLSAHHRRVARPEVTHQRLCRPPGLLGYPGTARDQRVALPIGPLFLLLVHAPHLRPGRVGHLGRGGACEQRAVHADRLPASQPLGRYGHQRQFFEMMLSLVLVQERRLPVKPAADDVIHGQYISLPARQYALSGVLGGPAAGDLGFR